MKMLSRDRALGISSPQIVASVTVRFSGGSSLQPLTIRENVTINRHLSLPFGKLESEFKALGNPDTQQTLEHGLGFGHDGFGGDAELLVEPVIGG